MGQGVGIDDEMDNWVGKLTVSSLHTGHTF